MDIMGYKSSWNEVDGKIPASRINVRSHIWDKGQGEHFFDGFKYRNSICRKVKNISIVDEAVANSDFAVQPVGDIYGHMMIKDNTVKSAVKTDELYPIMPNYVRDLAGRVICIAECYPIQKDSAKTKLFPLGSFEIGDDYEGYNLLENVFFANFRTLDMSPSYAADISGLVKNDFKYTYENANLHPYKLRIDSFYQDGWKIPQTEMLYIYKVKDVSVIDAAVKDFKEKWEVSENKNDYEAFYEECGGEEYFNQLYLKGVTLIPTLEAYNASAKVSRDFDLLDFHAGRYVQEFHDLDSYVDSQEPAGTIVKVLEPGFVTGTHMQKARVVVSNGFDYYSGNHEDPDPLYPDLKLPHSRIVGKWGDVHIPTHPKHFEPAAIWGWDSKTGVFLQEKGPAWDPLHYFYESSDLIIHHYQDDSIESNNWLFKVPDEMKQRFYPVVPFAGFDLFDSFEKEDRFDYLARPYTLCKRYSEELYTANIGYHPMPVEYELEIDPWVLPQLSPVNRTLTDVPLNIRDKMASIIQCNIPANLYSNRQSKNSEGNMYWLDDIEKTTDSTGDTLKDYQYLSRYLDNLTSTVKVSQLAHLFLKYSNSFTTDLQLSEYVAEVDLPKEIDTSIREFTLAYYDLKEKSFIRLKNRHKLYQNYYTEYLMNYWNSANCDDLTYMLKGESISKLEDSQFSSVAIMQPPTF